MGQVIYETSPLGAFISASWFAIFLVGFCVFDYRKTISSGSKLATTKDSMNRINVFLIIIGFVLIAFVILDFSYGARTIAVQVNDKTIHFGSKSSTHYYLHTDAYEFDIPGSIYYDIQVKSCYQITFYGGEYGSGTTVSEITKIVAVDSTACH